jgi:hypothetical protein
MKLKCIGLLAVIIILLVSVEPGGKALAAVKADDVNMINPTSTLPFPIRAAFFYPWFPEAWNQSGLNPFTRYNPSLGYYSEDNSQVISDQIAAMQYGKIQAGIASWWGIGHYTDKRIPLLLETAKNTTFLWSLYVESEGYGDPSVEGIRTDLTYIRDQYAVSPAYLKVDGKFVVFVYGSDSENCSMVKRWTDANTVNAYLVLKIFVGYKKCSQQPDAWHQYSPAVAQRQVGTYSFVISPGFALAGQDNTPLIRDIDRWKSDIQDMTASQTNFQMITTFNEWGEGTAVETANEWKSQSGFGDYLDALHWDGKDHLNIPGYFNNSRVYNPPTH